MNRLPPLLLLALLAAAPAAADLDVAFVLDTTGSMSGELTEAKERVVQLAASLAQVRRGERLRFAVVAYRDRGDEYVTRLSDLTDDVEASRAFLAALRAQGGGDGPEAVVAAVADALRRLDWDPSPETERQIFLIGDAPPHLDYRDDPKPEELISEARRARIAINAIGCRSLSDRGVAFFRRLAYATEGSYQHIGRVRAASPGLTEALLRSVKPRAAEAADRGDELAAGWQRHDGSVTAAGILARLGGAGGDQSGAAAPCTLEIVLPAGAGLDGDPRVWLGPRGLYVELALAAAGEGGLEVYGLERCPPLDTPIHVVLGGE